MLESLAILAGIAAIAIRRLGAFPSVAQVIPKPQSPEFERHSSPIAATNGKHIASPVFVPRPGFE